MIHSGLDISTDYILDMEGIVIHSIMNEHSMMLNFFNFIEIFGIGWRVQNIVANIRVAVGFSPNQLGTPLSALVLWSQPLLNPWVMHTMVDSE